MSLARIGLRGAYFTSLALVMRQILSLVTTFYVARHILPVDMGMFAMVMIVVGLAQVIGDVGIGSGLVRSQSESSAVVNTCFWISAGIGVVLSLAMFALAPVAGWFYENLEIIPLLKVSAIGLLVNFLLTVPMAILQQRLAYKSISISQAVGSLVGAIITISLAIHGAGVWSLVLQPIIGNATVLVLVLRYSRWRPRTEFNFSATRQILSMGMHLLGSGLAGYFRQCFDSVIIAKALKPSDLGVYGMTQQVLYAPMHLITSTVSRVIYPLLAKVQDEPKKVEQAVLIATARTALLICPIYFGLFMLAEEFVLNVLGANWIEMVPLIRIMVVSFLIQSIGNVSGPLMLALGKSHVVLRISIVGVVLYFVTLLNLISYGLIFVATGYAVVNSIIGLVSLGFALHYAGIGYLKYLSSILNPFLFSLVMIALIYGMQALVASPGIVGFASMILGGSLVYLALALVFERPALSQLISVIKK